MIRLDLGNFIRQLGDVQYGYHAFLEIVVFYQDLFEGSARRLVKDIIRRVPHISLSNVAQSGIIDCY